MSNLKCCRPYTGRDIYNYIMSSDSKMAKVLRRKYTLNDGTNKLNNAQYYQIQRYVVGMRIVTKGAISYKEYKETWKVEKVLN